MKKYAISLKQTLTSLLREMAATPAPYVKNPERDFTRKKKLPFETVMQLLIAMGGNSLYKELLESEGYDLCNRLYVDAIVQPRRLSNEGWALAAMVDRSPIAGKTIVIADLGYESYNNFAHLERKEWNYVIRVKDLNSNGILSGLRLPASGEFDIDVYLSLTKKQTKEVKAHPEIYMFVPSTSTFDFLDLQENLFYPISFRVVRFVLPNGGYETVITNLSAGDFPPDELKSIFARMIMYNFAEMMTSHVDISQMDKRHQYQVNFTVAVHVCRHYLRSRGDEPPLDVEALIRKTFCRFDPYAQGSKIRAKPVRNQLLASSTEQHNSVHMNIF